MFSKWIYFLLKFFDICGFYTEMDHLKSGSKGSITIFILHIFWALGTIVIVVTFTMHTRALAGVLPYMVNTALQNICGILTYWVIVIESFTQRKNQAKFWHIYQCIRTDQPHHRAHQKAYLNAYLIRLMSFFTAMIPNDLYLMYYFLNFVENYFFFRFTFFFFVTIYQIRIFYYLFHLELIKYELIAIKNALKNVAFVRDFKINSSPIVHHTNGRLRGSNRMKPIYKHYSLICELNDCVNQIFGWSHFVTILYCFGLPLTDANWAYTSFAERPVEYISGNLSNLKRI